MAEIAFLYFRRTLVIQKTTDNDCFPSEFDLITGGIVRIIEPTGVIGIKWREAVGDIQTAVMIGKHLFRGVKELRDGTFDHIRDIRMSTFAFGEDDIRCLRSGESGIEVVIQGDGFIPGMCAVLLSITRPDIGSRYINLSDIMVSALLEMIVEAIGSGVGMIDQRIFTRVHVDADIIAGVTQIHSSHGEAFLRDRIFHERTDHSIRIETFGIEDDTHLIRCGRGIETLRSQLQFPSRREDVGLSRIIVASELCKDKIIGVWRCDVVPLFVRKGKEDRVRGDGHLETVLPYSIHINGDQLVVVSGGGISKLQFVLPLLQGGKEGSRQIPRAIKPLRVKG